MDEKEKVKASLKKGMNTIIIANAIAASLFFVSFLITKNIFFAILTIVMFISSVVLFTYIKRIGKKYY